MLTSTTVETLARAADQILLLDGSGSVRLAESPEDAGLGRSLTIDDLRTLPINDNTDVDGPDEPSPAQKEEPSGMDLAARQKGDFSLYILYFQPVMKRVLVAWLVTTVFYSVAERAPGTFP